MDGTLYSESLESVPAAAASRSRFFFSRKSWRCLIHKHISFAQIPSLFFLCVYVVFFRKRLLEKRANAGIYLPPPSKLVNSALFVVCFFHIDQIRREIIHRVRLFDSRLFDPLSCTVAIPMVRKLYQALANEFRGEGGGMPKKKDHTKCNLTWKSRRVIAPSSRSFFSSGLRRANISLKRFLKFLVAMSFGSKLWYGATPLSGSPMTKY